VIENTFRIKKLDKTVNKILRNVDKFNTKNISDTEIIDMFNSKDICESIAGVYFTIHKFKGIKLFKSQLRAVVSLNKGYVTEMKTGEGKTLVILCYVLIKGRNEKIHIATTNDYLSKRDYENSKDIFEFLNIKSVFNDRDSRKDINNIYDNDVVYSSCESLIFDYLEYEYNKDFKFTFENVIIDEIDYVLVDNATSSFSVSGQVIGEVDYSNLLTVKGFVEDMQGYKMSKDELTNMEKMMWDLKSKEIVYDYYYEESSKFLCISDETFELIHNIFLHNKTDTFEISEIYLNIISYLKVLLFYKKDIEYTVKDGHIVLININNGRLLYNSSYESDIQAAIHVKENLFEQLEMRLENNMTYQIFFNMYNNLVGVSGTVKDIEQELNLLFGKGISIIPENKQSQREDFSDMMFETKEQSFEYTLKTIKNNYNKNPILIVCQSDFDAEKLYNFVYFNDVKAVIFNNSTPYEIEDKIIDKVGVPGTVTISTQLMGRGTDIILKSINKEKGLIVLCLGHFMSKRIDLQVRGRAGRQGENGYTQFINTFEDDIFKILSKRELNKIDKTFKTKEQLDNKDKVYTKYIKKAQSRFEYRGLQKRIDNYTYDYIIESNKPKYIYDIENHIDYVCEDEDSKITCYEILKLNWFIYKKFMLHIKYNIIVAYKNYSSMQRYVEFHRMSVQQLNEITDKSKDSIDDIVRELGRGQ